MLRDLKAEQRTDAAIALAKRLEFREARTLHKICALALDDFEEIMKDHRYVIDVNGSFHNPVTKTVDGERRTTCTVCVAGATMAIRLGAKIHRQYYENSGIFTATEKRNLEVVDFLRSGEIDYAFSTLHYGTPCGRIPMHAMRLDRRWSQKLDRLSQAATRTDGRRLVKAMRKMVVELETAGL